MCSVVYQLISSDSSLVLKYLLSLPRGFKGSSDRKTSFKSRKMVSQRNRTISIYTDEVNKKRFCDTFN